jgi:hypothetical protein
MIQRVIAMVPFLLAGCATYSSNMVVGNDMKNVSLSDQRAASLTVKTYDTVPFNATVISRVDAGRCHRSFVESAPKTDILLIDLKLAAYALGANGIANISIREESACILRPVTASLSIIQRVPGFPATIFSVVSRELAPWASSRL